jgi:hypothetical protein
MESKILIIAEYYEEYKKKGYSKIEEFEDDSYGLVYILEKNLLQVKEESKERLYTLEEMKKAYLAGMFIGYKDTPFDEFLKTL